MKPDMAATLKSTKYKGWRPAGCKKTCKKDCPDINKCWHNMLKKEKDWDEKHPNENILKVIDKYLI